MSGVSHPIERVTVTFDDPTLVADAGLIVPATLMLHLGLEALVNSTVRLVDRVGGARPGRKVCTLVASILAGGSQIDHADRLRAGATQQVLPFRVMAPSTLGTFLRSFTFGHVRQLDRVIGETIRRAWRLGAGPGASSMTIDLDSMICEVHGKQKQGAAYGYTRVLGYRVRCRHPGRRRRPDRRYGGHPLGPDGLRSWEERGGVVRIVFAAVPAYGHLYPLMPLALAAADAGHDVVVATGAPFLGRLPLPTVPGIEREFALSGVEDEVHRRYPELRAGFPATLVDFVTAMFGEVIAELVMPAVRDALAGADVLVYEAFNVGAVAAARECGIPAIAFGLGSVPPPLERIHQRAGLPGLPDRYLDPMPALLGSGAAGGIADRIEIRPVAWSEPTSGPPLEWPDPGRPESRRPRVYVTLGTVVHGRVDVLRRAIDELAELALDILVVVGPEGDVAALGALPPGVRAERFVPQDEVLDQVDLVVHHGGAGTTLGAAAASVPQLLLPQAADQFRNAEAVAAAGVGRGLPDVLAEPAGTIRAVAEALLSDGAERDAVRKLAAEIAAMPAPADVVRTLFSS